jgi:Terminase large subunit, T4likevirus-type, N-terminal
MIGADLARALDPARIGADCNLQLDTWQQALMRSTAPRTLLLAARQVGKTATTGLVACATAIGKPGALVLILSPSQRQSAEMFRVVLGYLKQIKGVTIAQESVLRVELSTGSRVIALPSSETTIRGYAAVDLVIIDEASRVADELIQAVRPMLATSAGGGRLIGLSTPRGRRGWFFDAWHGDGDWNRVRVTTDMCPRISQEFLDSELRELGAQRFAEEYGLEFLEADDAVFPTAVIDAAFTADVERLWL